MRHFLLVMAFLLLFTGTGRAECSLAVTEGTNDPRLNIAKINYLQCMWHLTYNRLVEFLWGNFGVDNICLEFNNVQATHDNVMFPVIFAANAEVLAVGCRVTGTCATPPTFDILDNDGDVISPASTPTCATGSGTVTMQSTTADADRDDFTAGTTPRINITESSPSCDWFTVCIKVRANPENLPTTTSTTTSTTTTTAP